MVREEFTRLTNEDWRAIIRELIEEWGLAEYARVEDGSRREPSAADRRAQVRASLNRTLRLIPLRYPECQTVDEPLEVMAKNISPDGLGFLYHRPVPYRYVALVFEGPHHVITLAMELNWCQFCGEGWYETGGRFLGPIRLAAPWDFASV